MMDGEAVRNVAELAQQAIGTVHHEDGVAFSAVPFAQVREEKRDEPAALELNTLEGLVDYLTANLDELEPHQAMIHVRSPRVVRVVTNLHGRDDAQRSTLVRATAHDLSDGFVGIWGSLEQTIIGLQTRFEHNSGRAEVLRLLGNISDEAEVRTEDDGVSQNVTTRAGITMKEREGVPNPVGLQPYRTFREVDQPESPFLLRLRRGREVEVAFFEADGGGWQLEAVERISGWLEHRTLELGFPLIQ